MTNEEIEAILNTIKRNIPLIIQAIGISDRDIKSSIRKYSERNDRFQSLPEFCVKPQSFIDWIVLAEGGDEKAKSFLKYIENASQELLNKLPDCFHLKIKNTFKEMAFAVEVDVNQLNNPVHMNFVGEIAALNHLISVDNNRYTLLKIEQELQNAKRIDFLMRDTKTGSEFGIDVVSVHNINLSKVETDKDLKAFLTMRCDQKIESKTNKLPEDQNRVIDISGKSIDFTILPLIWTELENLKAFKGVFKELDDRFINVLPFCALAAEQDTSGLIEHSFIRVSSALQA